MFSDKIRNNTEKLKFMGQFLPYISQYPSKIFSSTSHLQWAVSFCANVVSTAVKKGPTGG